MTRGLGGFQPWLIQRLTAIYLAAYCLIFLPIFLLRDWEFSTWHQFMGTPWMLCANLLFFVSWLLHAWVGIRDVVVDYVQPLLLRVMILSSVVATLLYFGFWALSILLKASEA
jgi:succinate dehydrogenase / fumarate reductase membrane anchor subunit